MDRTTSALVTGVVAGAVSFVSGTVFGDRSIGLRVGAITGAATGLVNWFAYDRVEVRVDRPATEIEIESIDVIED